MQLPVFLDIEASSLSSSSYPIEIAWNDHTGHIQSYLISPMGIKSWTDWSAKAEKIHGISQDTLITQGQSPTSVAQIIHQQLSKQVVYSDNPDYDEYWLGELFKKSAGLSLYVTVKSIDVLLTKILSPQFMEPTQLMFAIKNLKQQAKQQMTPQHRAASDVKYLLHLYRLAYTSP
ncbi:MAG TPA: hypothetical protein PK633_14300 [Agitococcus sp.]|nr:hypothetical protein [Agitococcus sp.]